MRKIAFFLLLFINYGTVSFAQENPADSKGSAGTTYKPDPAFDSSTNAFLADLSIFIDSLDAAGALFTDDKKDIPTIKAEKPASTDNGGSGFNLFSGIDDEEEETGSFGSGERMAWCTGLKSVVLASADEFRSVIQPQDKATVSAYANTTLAAMDGRPVRWDIAGKMIHVVMAPDSRNYEQLISDTRVCLSTVGYDWKATSNKGEFRSAAQKSTVRLKPDARGQVILNVTADR